jgi:elongator complex protein 2
MIQYKFILLNFFILFFCRIEDSSLLSCSLDKSMIVWRFDPDSGMWIETVRVGEVGGNTLGFLGCDLGNDGNTLIGYNFTG